MFKDALKDFVKAANSMDKEELNVYAQQILDEIGYDATMDKQAFVNEAMQKIADISPKLISNVRDMADIAETYYVKVYMPKKIKQSNKNKKSKRKKV